MRYTKPVILAEGKSFMAECRPDNKPSGRPCSPSKPNGTRMNTNENT